MIHFLITTSIYNDCLTRKDQYIKSINKLKELINKNEIENYKIIIIENNGLRKTFLDDFGCIVYYTNNNLLNTNNKGIKELTDIFDCIKDYNINDNDFIVKITGRYTLQDDNEFLNVIKNLNYDCVIKFGSFLQPDNNNKNDCITGLIGMRCYYLKMIEKPLENECIEWKWAQIANLIDNDKIYKINNLGLIMSPNAININHYKKMIKRS